MFSLENALEFPIVGWYQVPTSGIIPIKMLIEHPCDTVEYYVGDVKLKHEVISPTEHIVYVPAKAYEPGMVYLTASDTSVNFTYVFHLYLIDAYKMLYQADKPIPTFTLTRAVNNILQKTADATNPYYQPEYTQKVEYFNSIFKNIRVDSNGTDMTITIIVKQDSALEAFESEDFVLSVYDKHGDMRLTANINKMTYNTSNEKHYVFNSVPVKYVAAFALNVLNIPVLVCEVDFKLY